MRIDKFLADMGFGTRKEIKDKIRKGQVSLGDTVIKDPGFHVSESDIVLFSGKPIEYSKYVYYMLNKPPGVISATDDKRERTVTDLLLPDDWRKDIFPVGRLDKDTVGLLLLTNDGALAHRLLSPSHHVPKKYFVKVRGKLEESDIRHFETGIDIEDDDPTLPAKLSVISADDVSEAEVVIIEGRYHQIKRMFAALGKEVIYLKRVSMGGLTLDAALPEGKYRKLSEEELKSLMLPS